MSAKAVNVSLTTEDLKMLERLLDGECKFKRAVIFRRALRLYDMLDKTIKEGSQLMVKHKDGSLMQLVIQGLGG